jgi:hypothetical protein
MKAIRKGGRAWQLLTVAIVAVPWFFRDELAVRLDQRTRAAEAVHAALFNEEQRAQDAAEQRESRERLRHIEILLSGLAKESTKEETDAAKNDLFTESVKSEADELLTSVATLDEHLKDLAVQPQPAAGLDDDERKALDQWLGIDSSATGGLTKEHLVVLVAKVRKTAEAVAQADEDAAAPAELDDWPIAATAMHAAYSALSASAQRAQQSHSFWAGAARLIAWVFTALGALMIGDWSRLLGRPDADDSAGGGNKPT